MTLPKTDLLHIYRAMKLFRDVIQESPELINTREHELFLIAWQIVNDTQIEEYDYESKEK